MTNNQDTKNKNKNSDVIHILPRLVGIGSFILICVLAYGLWQDYQKDVDQQQDYAAYLKPIANLTTLKVQVAQLGVEVIMKQSPICTVKAEYAVNGVIEAGVNLLSMSNNDIDCDKATGTCNITLPQPHIVNCTLEPLDRYTEDINRYVCGAFDFEIADQIAIYQISRDILQDIKADEVIERAKRETSILMNSIFGSFGYKVNTRFAESEPMPLPASCVAEVPIGWGEYTEWNPGN